MVARLFVGGKSPPLGKDKEMNKKQYEMIENAPEYVEETAHLFDWSENYNFPSPASLFLDLIGFSEEHLGEDLCRDKKPSLGYLEIDMFAKALTEYATRPNDVYAWAEAWANADDEEEN